MVELAGKPIRMKRKELIAEHWKHFNTIAHRAGPWVHCKKCPNLISKNCPFCRKVHRALKHAKKNV